MAGSSCPGEGVTAVGRVRPRRSWVASPARAAARPELAAAAAQAAQTAQTAQTATLRRAEGAEAVVRRRKWDARWELAALARWLAPRLVVPRRLAALAQREKVHPARLWASSCQSCSEAWPARQGPLTATRARRPRRRKAPFFSRVGCVQRTTLRARGYCALNCWLRPHRSGSSAVQLLTVSAGGPCCWLRIPCRQLFGPPACDHFAWRKRSTGLAPPAAKQSAQSHSQSASARSLNGGGGEDVPAVLGR